MKNENNDANTGAEATDAGPSPDVEMQPITDGDLVSTTEYEAVEKEESADQASEDADTSDDAEQNTSEDQSGTKDFHEHPRFKELIEGKKASDAKIAELEAKLEAVAKPAGQPAQTQGQPPTFRNIMAMSDDDLAEEIAEKPKAFAVNLAAQIAHEIREDTRASEEARRAESETLSAKERIAKTVNDFFSDKPDGQEMLTDGRIKAFVKENPGHNEISAYQALAGEANLKAQIESAVKAEKEKIYKELKAKGRAKSTATDTGGGLLNPSKDPEMQNPDKYGGKKSVLLKRLLAMQKAS